jgi:hypothetical protein
MRIPGLIALLICCAPAGAQQLPTATVAPVRPAEPGILVEADTLIRLMVLNEVSSRTVAAGDRFVLRVDQAVTVDGATIIPAGAKAWGEVLDAQKSGSVGKAGRLQARLVSVEVGGEQVPISGRQETAGEKGGTQVALGMLGMGPLALLAPGNNAKLKAGEIFNAYLVTDMLFDPASGKLRPSSAQ